MSTQSRSQVIQSKPIGEGLDGFRNTFKSICDDIGVPNSSQALDQVGYEDTQDLLVTLIYALQGLPAARLLPSQNGNKSLFHDLLRLNAAVGSDDFDAERVRSLLDAILKLQPDEFVWDAVYNAITESTPPPRPTSSFQQTPLSINTGSFANSTEHRKHVDDVLREELGRLYVGIPGFFEIGYFWHPQLNSEPLDRPIGAKCKPFVKTSSGFTYVTADPTLRTCITLPSAYHRPPTVLPVLAAVCL